MQRLEFKKKPIPVGLQEDVDIIVKAFAESGYEVNDIDAYRAWSAHSDDAAAYWLILPENPHDIVRAAIVHLREA